jgi:hypothetical protein
MLDGYLFFFENDRCSIGHPKMVGILPQIDKTMRCAIFCECDTEIMKLYMNVENMNWNVVVDGTAWETMEKLTRMVNK